MLQRWLERSDQERVIRTLTMNDVNVARELSCEDCKGFRTDFLLVMEDSASQFTKCGYGVMKYFKLLSVE